MIFEITDTINETDEKYIFDGLGKALLLYQNSLNK